MTAEPYFAVLVVIRVNILKKMLQIMQQFFLHCKSLLSLKIFLLPIYLLQVLGIVPFKVSSKIGGYFVRMWNRICIVVYLSINFHLIYLYLNEQLPLEIKTYIMIYLVLPIFWQVIFIREIFNKDHGIIKNFRKLVDGVSETILIKELLLALVILIISIVILSLRCYETITDIINKSELSKVKGYTQWLRFDNLENYGVMVFFMVIYNIFIGIFPYVYMFTPSVIIANIAILLRKKLQKFIENVEYKAPSNIMSGQDCQLEIMEDFHKLRKSIRQFDSRLNAVIGVNIGIHILNICISYYT